MKAIIVKEIKTEVREIQEGKSYYREFKLPGFSGMNAEGSYKKIDVFSTEINYTLMKLYNPETKEEKNYYVKLEERGLWEDLVAVSDGFISSKINDGILVFKKEFEHYFLPKIEEDWFHRGIEQEYARIKFSPWWKRLLNKF